MWNLTMEEVSKINNTRKRYNRNAFLYDFIEAPLEFLRMASWREKLRSCIIGGRALEIGVGTGKNLPYYPRGMKISAIDFSGRMLSRARKKALQNNLKVDFFEMDAQQLAGALPISQELFTTRRSSPSLF